MPARKYNTEEERLQARREAAKRYHEEHKHDPKYIETRRACTKRYIEKNRELFALRSREYYHRNEAYRFKKLDRCAARWRDDPEFRERNLRASNERSWAKKHGQTYEKTVEQVDVQLEDLQIA